MPVHEVVEQRAALDQPRAARSADGGDSRARWVHAGTNPRTSRRPWRPVARRSHAARALQRERVEDRPVGQDADVVAARAPPRRAPSCRASTAARWFARRRARGSREPAHRGLGREPLRPGRCCRRRSPRSRAPSGSARSRTACTSRSGRFFDGMAIEKNGALIGRCPPTPASDPERGPWPSAGPSSRGDAVRSITSATTMDAGTSGPQGRRNHRVNSRRPTALASMPCRQVVHLRRDLVHVARHVHEIALQQVPEVTGPTLRAEELLGHDRQARTIHHHRLEKRRGVEAEHGDRVRQLVEVGLPRLGRIRLIALARIQRHAGCA